jgi:hypothetical protein
MPGMTDEQIEHTAKMLAAAYWRGRLESALESQPGALERAIKDVVDRDWPRWREAAWVARQ